MIKVGDMDFGQFRKGYILSSVNEGVFFVDEELKKVEGDKEDIDEFEREPSDVLC